MNIFDDPNNWKDEAGNQPPLVYHGTYFLFPAGGPDTLLTYVGTLQTIPSDHTDTTSYYRFGFVVVGSSPTGLAVPQLVLSTSGADVTAGGGSAGIAPYTITSGDSFGYINTSTTSNPRLSVPNSQFEHDVYLMSGGPSAIVGGTPIDSYSLLPLAAFPVAASFVPEVEVDGDVCFWSDFVLCTEDCAG